MSHIRSKLPLEIQMLWDASKKVRLSNEVFREELRRSVQRERQRYNQRLRQDALATKVFSFGNEGGWANHKIKDLSQILFRDKPPAAIDLGEWISVELELIMPSEAAETAFIGFVRTNGYKNMVTIKADGSVRPRECQCERDEDDDLDEHEESCDHYTGTMYGREIVLTCKIGDWDFIKAICKKLRELGCTVNKSCGLHVHFDMRHLEERRKVSVLALRVAKAVPALKQILPASRQNNRFCNRVINSFRDDDRNEGRYSFVNVKSYDRHKTLEIRGHSGTIDPVKIINWVRIIRTIMAKPNRTDLPTLVDLMTKIQFEPDLIEYFNTRRAKFAAVQTPGDDVFNDQAPYAVPETFSIGNAVEFDDEADAALISSDPEHAMLERQAQRQRERLAAGQAPAMTFEELNRVMGERLQEMSVRFFNTETTVITNSDGTVTIQSPSGDNSGSSVA